MPWKISKRTVKWFAITLFFVFLLLVHLILSTDLTVDDDAVYESLSRVDSEIELEYKNIGDYEVRVVSTSDDSDSAPLICFVHGAPGGLTAFSGLLRDSLLRNQFDMMSYDRPGYGPRDQGRAMVDIQDQAIVLSQLVRAGVATGQKTIFVSHSFGGPIAALAALHLDTLVLAHIMLSPVISPEDENIFWYSSIPLLWPFRIIASDGFSVAAQEKIAHPDETSKHKERWNEIRSKTIHWHGSKDWLAPVENVAFAKSYFLPDHFESLILEDASHFLPWTQGMLIKQKLLDLKVSLEVTK